MLASSGSSLETQWRILLKLETPGVLLMYHQVACKQVADVKTVMICSV